MSHIFIRSPDGKLYIKIFVFFYVDVKDAVVIVSDGFSSIGIEGIKEKTDIAKHVGIQIYAVGITSKVKKAELRIMASQPIGRHFFTLKHSPNIKSIVDRIVKDLCKHF